MNVYLPNLRLPIEYQEVEYIESSGTQYINTGYIPSNNTKIECKIGSWNTSIGRYETMYGARKQYSTSNSQGFYIDYDNNGSGGHNYGFGKDYSSSSLFTFQDGGIHIIEQSSNGLYQDGILKKTFDAMTFTSPVNMCISALNDNGTIKEYGGFKLYFFKIWTSGNLVRDFVPCYRKSDSVIGLYDLVNNQFYTNSGTGTFSKGNDVTMAELKNAYIGDVWTYDFRGKTKSQVTSDGWNLQSTATVDANGLTDTTWGTEWRNLPYDITNANKITIVRGLYAPSGAGVGLYMVNTSNTNNTGLYLEPSSNILQQYIYGSKTDYTAQYSKTFEISNIFDFQNNVAIAKLGDTIKNTQLSSTQINNIKSYMKRFRIATNRTSYIQYIKMMVE